MSGFSAEWLALREPHDDAARAAELVELCRARVDSRRAIVDLGAGSGANLRWLAPRLRGEQTWSLVDHDAALLAAVEHSLRDWATAQGAELRIGDGSARRDTRLPPGDSAARRATELDAGGDADGAELSVRGADFSCRVRRTCLDLAAELTRIELPSRALVTSSALLDLVSARWLEALAQRCRAAAADVYFALTYDGRTECTPAEPEDAEVLELFNRHQRGDKGFGAALGPTAAQRAPEIFAALGYRVTMEPSDWRIAARDAPFQRALLAGWVDAALEIAPERGAALRAWHARRLAHVEARRSELVVGHVDLVGLWTR